jgi:hypothetical protein
MVARATLRALGVALAALALAVSVGDAATVGLACTASWAAPTTNTDGTAVAAGEITAYRIYVDKTTVTPNVTPPTMSVSSTTLSAAICAGLTPGTHTFQVSAVAGPNEGAATTPFSFALVTVTPSSPSNPTVQ